MLSPFIFVRCFTLSCSFMFVIIGIPQKTGQHVHSIFSVTTLAKASFFCLLVTKGGVETNSFMITVLV